MDKNRENRMIDLLDLILEASAESIQSLSCPFCHGSLDIAFVDVHPVGTTKHRVRKRMSLHVQCKECPWKSVADGLPHLPAWVEMLGPKVQTSVIVLDGHKANKKRTISQVKGVADDLLALRKAKRSEGKKKSIPLAEVKRELEPR